MKNLNAWLNQGFNNSLALTALGCVVAFVGFFVHFTVRDIPYLGLTLQVLGTAGAIVALRRATAAERRKYQDRER